MRYNSWRSALQVMKLSTLRTAVWEAISYYAILASTSLAKERGAYETFPGSKWERGSLPIDTLELLEAERGEPIDVDRKASLDWQPVRDAIQEHGMRNSNCLAIAPTATISAIRRCVAIHRARTTSSYVRQEQSVG